MESHPSIENTPHERLALLSRRQRKLPVATLRLWYGSDFAPGESPHARLEAVIDKLDGAALRKLAADAMAFTGRKPKAGIGYLENRIEA